MTLKNQSEIKNISDLKYFKIVNLGHIATSMNLLSALPDCRPMDIPPYCRTNKPDLVWCKSGDSCGTTDWMCDPSCASARCAHDGCCSGIWDWGGDDRKSFGQQDDVIQPL
jgi:hypothetical protein